MYIYIPSVTHSFNSRISIALSASMQAARKMALWQTRRCYSLIRRCEACWFDLFVRGQHCTVGKQHQQVFEKNRTTAQCSFTLIFQALCVDGTNQKKQWFSQKDTGSYLKKKKKSLQQKFANFNTFFRHDFMSFHSQFSWLCYTIKTQ